MADSELAHVRAPEPLTIKVVRARNLKGQRGDSVNTTVKVEFGEKSIGESPKVECGPEAPAEINYNTTINVTFEDPHALEEIACKPVLCTIIEVLPKEKKQKEEKTGILGQCTVDLLPLLKGETRCKYTLIVNPVPGSPLEAIPPESPKPELDVEISVNEPLLNESQLKESNLIGITIESLYSTPDSWGLGGPQFNYTTALPLPISSTKENVLVFAGGMLKPGVDKEVPNRQKKWAVPAGAVGNAVYIPDKNLSSDPVEDEDGDFKAKEDRDHRNTAEQDKNRVTWNIERRSYMDNGACKNMQEKIAKTRYWPVEIVRTPQVAGAKGGKGKEDESHVSFHGVVYLNLAPLLYPGVKRIRGAYKVYPFMEHELHEKCDRKGGMADEAIRIANGILNRTGSSPFPKPGKGKDESKKDVKKGLNPPPSRQRKGSTVRDIGLPKTLDDLQPSGVKASDSASEGAPEVVNAEGQQYVEAKSYITIEINLNRPLVPKRPPEELAKRVAEYIPPRPVFPKRTDGAQRAVADYHNQVGVVANLILDEFREKFGDMFQKGDLRNTPEAMEERRQQLVYHLNSSGKYFAFKEQLKHAVVKIVREKYLRTSNFKDRDELQHFLSELYVYLVDQMHVGLSNVLQIEDQSPIPDPLTDSAQLKHFAREAEVNGNFELASKYYQERIARDKNDPDHWLDYGTFCLYINDLTKAEECFKECVSIDQRHLEGLELYGVVCTMQDKHEAAETFFEAATSFEPKSILAWTMLGLFYDGIGNEIGAEMALLEANKLNVMEAAAALKVQHRDEISHISEKDAAEKKDDMAVGAEEQELMSADASLHKMAATPTSIVGSDGKPRTSQSKERRPSARKSVLSVQSVRKASLSRVSKAPVINDKPGQSVHRNNRRTRTSRLKSTENVSRPGSVRNKSPSLQEKAIHEETQQHDTSATLKEAAVLPTPSVSIFMQVVEFLLEVKAMPFTERALAHHLLDPLGGPSADYYIALARLKLQKQQMEEAEEALKEALQFDHQHPDAWAIMGHVKYMLGDTDVARDCYERTLAFIADASEMHSIYLRLASIYLQEGKYQDSKNTFLLACKKSPSCVSWLGVGIACYRLGELSESEDALAEANVLNNTDPEVWAYLSLVCLRTGRQLEAEQAYKYAIKLNLQDEPLLNELTAVQEEIGFGNPQF